MNSLKFHRFEKTYYSSGTQVFCYFLCEYPQAMSNIFIIAGADPTALAVRHRYFVAMIPRFGG